MKPAKTVFAPLLFGTPKYWGRVSNPPLPKYIIQNWQDTASLA